MTKNGIVGATTWVGLEGTFLREIRRDVTYMETFIKKIKANEQTEPHKETKNKRCLPGGEGGDRGESGQHRDKFARCQAVPGSQRGVRPKLPERGHRSVAHPRRVNTACHLLGRRPDSEIRGAEAEGEVPGGRRRDASARPVSDVAVRKGWRVASRRRRRGGTRTAVGPGRAMSQCSAQRRTPRRRDP